MVIIAFGSNFQKTFSKIKDPLLKLKVLKQLEKIKENPETGKPMRNTRKGTQELYISPYRLSYVFLKNESKIVILDSYHKDNQ